MDATSESIRGVKGQSRPFLRVKWEVTRSCSENCEPWEPGTAIFVKLRYVLIYIYIYIYTYIVETVSSPCLVNMLILGRNEPHPFAPSWDTADGLRGRLRTRPTPGRQQKELANTLLTFQKTMVQAVYPTI